MLVPRLAKLAAPGAAVALLATGSAVALPDQAKDPDQQGSKDTTTASGTAAALADRGRSARRDNSSERKSRTERGSRGTRPALKSTLSGSQAKLPTPKVSGVKYVTAELNVWTEPDEKGDLITVLKPGTKVSVTSEVDGDWAEVVRDGTSTWVRAKYLSTKKPDEGSGGISSAACPSGSDVESGMTPDAIRVHRAICAKFPSVDNFFGTESGSGEHGEGRAVDAMVYGDSSTGDAIADFLRENHKALGVSEVIWQQRIWTVQRSSEGWRSMEDRGSDSANHMDHVHATVYGSSGTT